MTSLSHTVRNTGTFNGFKILPEKPVIGYLPCNYVMHHVQCKTAQKWHLSVFFYLHKYIYTAMTTVYVDTRAELGQNRHNLVWLLCSIASLH